MFDQKEFAMTESDYKYISQTVYEECGIVLSAQKKDMVYSRIARRIRLLQLDSFSDYIRYLESNTEAEFSNFINAITTNLTSFFREPHHFEFLEQKLLPIMKRNHTEDHRVRVWSAGCSTGMEPYSIAMTLHNKFPNHWDFKILATDLDTSVLATAKAGVYEAQSITGIDNGRLQSFFKLDPTGQKYKVKDKIKNLITFKQLNLLEGWPMKGPFDVIFCRNVVIYFDLATKNKLFERFSELLRPNGYLILGHSETMSREVKAYTPLGSTIYKKN